MLVRGAGEPVGVDEGLVGRVGGADGDVAPGEGRDKGGGEGGVLIAVDGRGREVVELVAEVGCDREVFDFLVGSLASEWMF